jgi:hypothetical protein
VSTTIDITTVTHAISTLSISGVVIKDIHEVVAGLGLATAVLAPRPKDFVTNFRVEPVEVTKSRLNVYYTLNYVYYHCPIGNNIFADYPALWTKIALIAAALSDDAAIAGAVDHDPVKVGSMSGMMDNAGNLFHGCEFSKDFMQFLEV